MTALFRLFRGQAWSNTSVKTKLILLLFPCACVGLGVVVLQTPRASREVCSDGIIKDKVFLPPQNGNFGCANAISRKCLS